jgi:hypothetical protein
MMVFLQSASFAVLINGDPSYFFISSQGLREGCPLSPFLFLLITEALNIIIKEAHSNGSIRGVRVTETKSISHLLFMDDIFISLFSSIQDMSFKNSLNLFFTSILGMKVNLDKSCLILNHCLEVEDNSFHNLILAQRK